MKAVWTIALVTLLAVPRGAFAQKTEGEAQSAVRVAQNKFSVLSGYQPLIRKKDQGDRGVFYAAQVGPLPRVEANQLCENLKSAGGNCFIQRN